MNNHSLSSHAVFAGLDGAFNWFSRRVHNWKIRRQVRSMRDLDDRMLADIGVQRDEVEWASQLPLDVNPAIELSRISRCRRARPHGW
jgi:uncharacterized protein YjiS (DUF1127 family)